jgi:hypothetical protein
MGEMESTERDMVCPVRRGQRGDQRPRETTETNVVWLIIQRSRFKSLPRHQGQRPSFEQEEGL